jgi:hypothetical protein
VICDAADVMCCMNLSVCVVCVCVHMLDVVYDYRAYICEVPVPVHFPAGDFGLLFSAFFTCVFYVRFVLNS